MKRLWLFALLGTVGIFGAPAAHAGPVWSLDWQFGTNVLISNSGRSLIVFTPHNTISSTISSTPLVAQIADRSAVADAHPDSITRQNFGVYLKLTDLASHASRFLWFSGSLTGTLSRHTANLTSHFYGPSTYWNVLLGKNFYTISMGPLALPRASNHFQGSLDVRLSYAQFVVDPPVSPRALGTPVAGPGGVHSSPEPSSLMLGGLGLVLAGFGAWRRRRRTAR